MVRDRQSAWWCIVACAGLVAAGCSDDRRGAGQTGEQDPSVACEAIQPGPAPVRLLTREQYNNVVRDLLGDDTRPADQFPAQATVDGFDNNAELHLANPLLVSQYQRAAEQVAVRALAGGLELPCALEEGTESCGEELIASFGRRAFRRPLTAEEEDIFLRLFRSTLQTKDFRTAIQLVVETALQSPQFLYRIDSMAAPTSESGAVRLGPWEMASRLSFFLWNSIPDEPLFQAAESGELATNEQIALQARRMLEDDRARGVVRDFHRQWLGLDLFDSIARDAPEHADIEDELPDRWRSSLDAFIDHVYWQAGGNVDTLFSASAVFLDEVTAPVYGVEPPAAGELVRVELDPAERAGLLTQPALVGLLSHPDQSSPVRRGLFVRERLLCDPLPPPPPDVDTTPPSPDPTLTTRERFAIHREAPECAMCHERMDPIGFGLEKYDQLGRFRADENGLPIDASGEIVDPPTEDLAGAFNGAVDLAGRLAQSERVRDCIATQWYRFATGRIEGEADACSIEDVQTAFSDSDGDFRELLVAITQADAFLYRPPGPQDMEP